MAAARVHLRGPDHTVAGEVAVEAAGHRAAAGLTRGWAPKPYAYTDPNEDAVAVAVGPSGTLLTVADGHGGSQSSLQAVDMVLDALGDDPPAAVEPARLVRIFDAANAAIVDGARSRPPSHRDSATTLVAALVAAGRVQWASVGDSVALISAPGQSRLLTSVSRRYLGQTGRVGLDHAGRGVGAGSVAPFVSQGVAEAPAGAWVVVATDGYSDWAPSGGDLARATGLWIAAADAATDAVSRLMGQARVGGAGDNVAVAVARVPAA